MRKILQILMILPSMAIASGDEAKVEGSAARVAKSAVSVTEESKSEEPRERAEGKHIRIKIDGKDIIVSEGIEGSKRTITVPKEVFVRALFEEKIFKAGQSKQEMGESLESPEAKLVFMSLLPS